MLLNMRFNGLGMNLETDEPQLTGECNLDLVVDGQLSGEERVILITQSVDIPLIGEIVVGWLVVAVHSGNRWFLLNPGLGLPDQNYSSTEASVDQVDPTGIPPESPNDAAAPNPGESLA